MRIWSWFRKAVPFLFMAAVLSNAFSVAPAMAAGPATKLAFGQGPTNTLANAGISPSITVLVQDASGLLVASTASITLAIDTNPSNGTLSGTVTRNAVAGVATFPGLSINNAGSGYTLSASSSGLTEAISNTFDISIGPANRLAFTAQPSNTAAGAAISPAITVTVQDAAGNTVTSSTDSITLAIGTNPSGGTLSGTATVAAITGVATFSDLSINKPGTGYRLAASSGSLTGATSSSFNISIGAANKLAFAAQPTDTGSNISITPAVTVIVQDVAGNTVTASTASITLAIGTNPSSGTLSGTKTVAAIAGVATFSNLSIDNTGTGYTLSASSNGLVGATSTAFNIFGPATKLTFSVQPLDTAAGATITPSVKITVQDAAGHTVTSSSASITIAIGTNPSGGTLSGTTTVAAVTGVATFNNLSINNAGTGYTLSASSNGLTGTTSNAFNISIGAAAKLAITVQPSSTVAGATITPAITVTVQDSSNNTVTSSTASITLAIGNNPAGGALSGTTTVTATAGVATFNDLSINNAGIGYTLSASSTSLTGVTSTAFNVIGPASKLVFTVQPSNTTTGSAITPAITVTVQDVAGNTVTSSTAPITLAIVTNPSSGTLSGTVTRNAVAGVATFNDLSINNAGTGYTLSATSTGLTGAMSAAFNLFGPAAKLAFTIQPSNTAAGATITPSITITVQDAAGYTITSSTASIALAFGTNPSAATLSGTTTVAAVAGVATFNNLSINKVGTGYTLRATSGTLTIATSAAFNIVAGIPTVSAISPNFGPVAGGTSVTITGTGFVAGATVTVGGITATNVTVVSVTSITATTPTSATTGAKNVVVTTAGGSGTLTNGFTYIPNWWNTSWNYRAQITITNQTASVLAPYEVKIAVTYKSNMKANFTDLRFVASDNTTQLSYWINSNKLVPSASAEIWVQVPSIPASGSVNIYMYYGNSSVTATTSNIHTTFIFGDDFEDPTWTATHIYANNVGGSPTHNGIVTDGTNHVWEQSGNNTGKPTNDPTLDEPIAEIASGAGSLTPFPLSYNVEVDTRAVGSITPLSGGAESVYICNRYFDVNSKYEQVLDFTNNYTDLNKVVLGGTPPDGIWTNLGSSALGFPTVANTWYTLGAPVVRDVSGNTDDLQVFVNGLLKISTSDNSLMTNTGLAFITYNNSGPFDGEFDNIRVRHYAYIEPTASIGTEQPQTPPPPPDGGGGGVPIFGPSTPGITSVANIIDKNGVFTQAITALSDDSQAILRIEAGTVIKTVDGSALTQITIASMQTPPTVPTGAGIIGLAYDFGPSGLTFGSPVTIKIFYDPSKIPTGVAESSLQIAYFDSTKGVWVTLSSVVDTSSHSITAQITHFTPYAITYGVKVVTPVPTTTPPAPTTTPPVPTTTQPAPAAFSASNLVVSPLEVNVGDSVKISALVKNTGGQSGNYVVDLNINGQKVDSQSLTLASGASQTVTFTTSGNTVGNYTVAVNNLSGTFTVKKTPVPATFTTGSLTISPSEINTGETATIQVTVTNSGDLAGTTTAVLKLNNNIIATKDLALAVGESQNATFTTTQNTAGTYTVDINGQSGTLIVKVAPSNKPFILRNWWILVVILVVVALITVITISVSRKRIAPTDKNLPGS